MGDEETRTAVDLAELKRLAQAATPGPWKAYEHPRKGPCVGAPKCNPLAEEVMDNEYIAACSPEVIIELVDAVDSARSDKGRLAFHRAAAQQYAKEADSLQAERDALRARVAELEAERDGEVQSILAAPGLRAKLSQDDLHALLRWRSAYGRTQRKLGRVEERAAVVALTMRDEIADVARRMYKAGGDGEMVADAVLGYLRAVIERGDHVAVEPQRGEG